MSQLLIAHTPLGKDWWVISLQGNEALSSLYEFRLELKSENPDIDIQSMIGEACTVECKDGPLSSIRYFSGLAIATKAKGKPDKHWLYELTIAPKLWFASRRADFKIYQNLTAQAIADEVLQRNAILDHEWRLNSSYKTWEYVVQYGETDLAFLLRLLGHEGIYFWFEHGKDGEKLILGDHFNRHDPFAGYEKIPYYPSDAPLVEEDHFNSWRTSRVAEPGKFVQTSYDFQHPSENLKAESADPRGHLFDQYEIFSYRGSFTESEHSPEYAAAQLHGMQSNQNVTVLEGPVRGAIPGCRFTLEKHPVKSQNCDFTIISAEYRARNNEYEAEGGDQSEEEPLFHVKISAIPADRQYRTPSNKYKMPRAHGSDTAVVVGPEGSEIHTDEYGRVKVHFHWDRYGQKDGKDSCWIRVVYPWAGSNFGSIYIPRVGQEIVVDYEHGDPQRPIIAGRVYNAQQMPPWDLPANKTQSGVLTRSGLGGTSENANALRFDDAKGQEEVWLHAEKDMNTDVENDDTTKVGHDQSLTVENDRTVTVKGNENRTVEKDQSNTIKQNQTNTVDLDQTNTIKQNQINTVDMDQTNTIKQNQNNTVDMDQTNTIKQNQINTVDMDQTNTIKQNQNNTITLDQATTVVGSQYNDVKQSQMNIIGAGGQYNRIAGNATTVVAQNQSITVAGNMMYEAAHIGLKATGGNSLEMEALKVATLALEESSSAQTEDTCTWGRKTHFHGGSVDQINLGLLMSLMLGLEVKDSLLALHSYGLRLTSSILDWKLGPMHFTPAIFRAAGTAAENVTKAKASVEAAEAGLKAAKRYGIARKIARANNIARATKELKIAEAGLKTAKETRHGIELKNAVTSASIVGVQETIQFAKQLAIGDLHLPTSDDNSASIKKAAEAASAIDTAAETANEDDKKELTELAGRIRALYGTESS